MIFKYIKLIVGYSIAYVICLNSLLSCASYAPPMGGPKDQEYAELLRTIPAQHATQVKGTDVVYTFNEGIDLEQFQEQFRISPKLTTIPEYEINKNNLIIHLKQLKPNETYSIEWENGIKDIHESLKSSIPILTFSTGNQIDTGKIFGKAIHHWTKKPMANAQVILYDAYSDSNHLLASKPRYITKTDPFGHFAFYNIDQKTYRLASWVDNNKNGLWNAETELAGIYGKPIKKDIHDSLLLELLHFPLEKIKIKNIDRAEVTTISLNHGFRNLEFKNDTHNFKYRYDSDKNNLLIFNRIQDDSTQIVFTTTDSLYRDSTFTIRNKKKQANKKIKKTANMEFVCTSLRCDSVYIKITSLTPIQIPKLAYYQISIDSLQKFKYLVNNDFKLNQSNTVLTGKRKFKAKESIRIQMPKNTFFTWIDDSLYIADQKWVKPVLEEGYIKVKIATEKKNFHIQLIDPQGKVIETSSLIEHTFENLKPNTYTLRAWIDENKDSEFNPGDVLKYQEPEQTYLYAKPIQIIKNWEIDTILFSF